MKNNGGPAFPEISGYRLKSGDGELEKINCSPGMSLRDYFAANAMEIIDSFLKPETIARLSYEMADAMLAEREK